MTYVLEKLMTVRDLRENRALNRLVQSREALMRAEELKQRKERELGAYRDWRLDQERRLFGELQNKPAALKDLNLYRDTVRSLRRDQAEQSRQVEAAAGRVIEAREELEKARQHHARAYRKKAKIQEHKSIWMEARHQQIEKQAENEMEEAGRTILPN